MVKKTRDMRNWVIGTERRTASDEFSLYCRACGALTTRNWEEDMSRPLFSCGACGSTNVTTGPP